MAAAAAAAEAAAAEAEAEADTEAGAEAAAEAGAGSKKEKQRLKQQQDNHHLAAPYTVIHVVPPCRSTTAVVDDSPTVVRCIPKWRTCGWSAPGTEFGSGGRGGGGSPAPASVMGELHPTGYRIS